MNISRAIPSREQRRYYRDWISVVIRKAIINCSSSFKHVLSRNGKVTSLTESIHVIEQNIKWDILTVTQKDIHSDKGSPSYTLLSRRRWQTSDKYSYLQKSLNNHLWSALNGIRPTYSPASSRLHGEEQFCVLTG